MRKTKIKKTPDEALANSIARALKKYTLAGGNLPTAIGVLETVKLGLFSAN